MGKNKQQMVSKKMIFVGAGILVVLVIVLVGVYGKNIRTAADSGTACLSQADHDKKVQDLASLQKQLASLNSGSSEKGNTVPKGPIKQLMVDIAAESQKVKLPAGVDILQVTAALDYTFEQQTILDNCARYPDQCPYNNSQYREIEQNIEEDTATVKPMLDKINADPKLATLQRMIKNLQQLLIQRSDLERKIADTNNELKKPICATPTPTTKPTNTPSPTPNPTHTPTPTIIKPTLPPASSPKLR